jgi:hypothetical protein
MPGPSLEYDISIYVSHISGMTVLEIPGAAMITNQTRAPELIDKAKCTSAEKGVCASDLSQASQQHTHTGRRTASVFIHYSGMPLCSKEEAWVHCLHDWLRLRFRGGYRGRADMIGEHGQKLNLVDVPKDKEVTHKAGILGFWGNWGLKWLFDLKWQHIINPGPRGPWSTDSFG